MFTIQTTPEFDRWIKSLKDVKTRMRLLARLAKAKRGLLGDVKPVGEGVMEMREFFGSGWRMYYVQYDDRLVVMLGGGDKSTQPLDIKRAQELIAELRGFEDDS